MESTTKELAVRIESQGGILTLTPESLLRYYLADAHEIQGRPGVYEGLHPSDPSKRLYVQKEALAGLLMDAREKHLNPITEMYLIPSNSPNKKASHKVKYTAGLMQLRKLPGYLALHSGLIVKRGDEIKETTGSFYLDGDVLLAAWCEVDFIGHRRPIRHEVSLKEARRTSPHWNDRPATMLLKTVEDQCVYLKVLPTFGQEKGEGSEEDEIILEATEAGTYVHPEQQKKLEPFAFQPDVPYYGEITRLLPVEVAEKDGKKKRKPGIIAIATKHGELAAFFYERPVCLKNEENWQSFIGLPGKLTFEAKQDAAKTGTFWYVKYFAILKPDDLTEDTVDPQDEPGDGQETEEGEQAA